jgi:DNA-binding HxlR family transcriptional regulator
MTDSKFNVYMQRCPSHNVLEGISDKWSILIINILLKKIFRFGELKRELQGISPKMLTKTLIQLERLGLVDRKAFPVLPLKVEYSLTPLGKELASILNLLTVWTERNMDNIILAENKYIRCYEVSS